VAKKPKTEGAPAPVEVVAEAKTQPAVIYEVNEPNQNAGIDRDVLSEICRPLVCTKAIAIIRDEIEAELPKIRNLCPAVSFFCEETLRCLSALSDNQNAYKEKLLIEARQRAADSRGAGK
jgi:hypothetical protein